MLRAWAKPFGPLAKAIFHPLSSVLSRAARAINTVCCAVRRGAKATPTFCSIFSRLRHARCSQRCHRLSLLLWLGSLCAQAPFKPSAQNFLLSVSSRRIEAISVTSSFLNSKTFLSAPPGRPIACALCLPVCLRLACNAPSARCEAAISLTSSCLRISRR